MIVSKEIEIFTSFCRMNEPLHKNSYILTKDLHNIQDVVKYNYVY